jgi:hypothetical protein
MFYASIVVCALYSNPTVDTTRCITLNDTWGPYKTEENCVIRTNQMTRDTSTPLMQSVIFPMLGYPPQITVVSQSCSILPGSEA